MENKSCLIGYSGFVGGNILNQKKFNMLYNSKNIEEIQMKEFSIVVCAAAPGTKWFANKYPEKDLSSIERLMSNLKKVETEKFVLISTINVYPNPCDVNEDTPIDSKELLPYGLHRRILEEFVENTFNATIIRLPALFGKGLKKNVIYDLLNKNYQYINQDSTYQYYNLDNIWLDINRTLENKIKILNCAIEPITIGEVQRKCFNINVSSNNTNPISCENVCTKYGHLWGKEIPYLYKKAEVLRGIKSFVRKYKQS